jgi:ABC-2 type transport system permease protein
LRAHRILTIARRDYIATVRTKAFLFGLIVAPILFGGGSIGMSLIKGKPDTTERHIAIIDHTGVVGDALIRAAGEKNRKELFDKKTGQQVAPRYAFELVPPASANPQEQLLALSDRVRRHELAAIVEIGARAVHPPEPADDAKASAGENDDPASGVSYYTNTGGIDELRNWLNGPVNDGVRSARLSEIGIDVSRLEGLTVSVPITRLGLVERDPVTGRIQEAHKRGELESFFVPFAVAIILAMIVMVGSAPMLQNVTQDKSQRIVEMLLGAVSPLELMTGKVLGSVAVSVTSSLFYVVGGLLVVNAMGLSGMLPITILPWFYVYLLADVTMLCALAAALGAACSTPQDAQNLAIVLLTPCLIPMFTLVTVLRQPNGLVSTVLSLIPPFTPVLMLLRQAVPNGVPAWQPWVGLAGVLAFTLASVWAASRIFRVAILMQGKPPRMADLVRWAVRG